MNDMSKYIVTGSEGFIGKALVAFLVAQGHEAVCIDRRLEDGIEASDIGRILDTTEDVAGVFHLAAQTSVFNLAKREILSDNIDTFITVCDECAARGKKLVYASSSTAARDNATSMYGLSKRFDEQYARLYNRDAIGVRLHNVYGPDPRQGTLLWHLMNDDVVDIWDMGNQVRHFTYIDDVVKGLCSVMQTEPELGETMLVNIVNPEMTTVASFASEVSARNGASLRFHGEVRERDNLYQSVEKGIICLPLQYKAVQEGLDAILGERDGRRIGDNKPI